MIIFDILIWITIVAVVTRKLWRNTKCVKRKAVDGWYCWHLVDLEFDESKKVRHRCHECVTNHVNEYQNFKVGWWFVCLFRYWSDHFGKHLFILRTTWFIVIRWLPISECSYHWMFRWSTSCISWTAMLYGMPIYLDWG